MDVFLSNVLVDEKLLGIISSMCTYLVLSDSTIQAENSILEAHLSVSYVGLKLSCNA